MEYKPPTRAISPTRHRKPGIARFGSAELACRLAMNGYQDLLHNYQPPD